MRSGAWMSLVITTMANIPEQVQVSYSQTVTFAAESTVQQGGEKFSAHHVRQFVRDLVFDFAAEQGHEID